MYELDLGEMNYTEALDVDNSIITDDFESEVYAFGAMSAAALGIGLVTYAVNEPGASPGHAGWGAAFLTGAVGSGAMAYLKKR